MTGAERSRRYRAKLRRQRLGAFEATRWGAYVATLPTLEELARDLPTLEDLIRDL